MSRLLLVEDHDLIALSLIDLLEAEGHAVTWCASGLDGLECAVSDSHDAIVVDLLLPGLDGLTLLKKLRERSVDTPVIVISGSASVAVREKAEQLGAHAVLRKPFDIDSLLKAVCRALSARDRTAFRTGNALVAGALRRTRAEALPSPVELGGSAPQWVPS